jgi:hypothetical protein
MKLVPDQSYTANGIFIALQTRSLVTDLKARIFAGKTVRLTWSEAGPGQRGKYLIYRDSAPITNSEKLALSEFLGSVNMGITEFVDEEPGSETYYAVLAKLDDGTFDNNLVEGANYTSEPLVIGDRIRPVSINASIKDGAVRVSWKYKGGHGSADYSMLRLTERINDPLLLKKENVISAVNIKDGRFIDNPPPGNYYYAILPPERSSWGETRLSDGVNITAKAVLVRDTSVQHGDRGKVIPETIEIPENVERPSSKTVTTGLVDDILRETFFRGRYNSAITRLEKVVRSEEGEIDIAKARLFIGRSYIEKRMYRKSLDYLLRRDVKTHFPREANFWSSFAISRIKDR